MDPLTLSTQGAIAALVTAIVVAAYHKWIAPAAAPAQAPALASHPILQVALQHGADLLTQLASGAVKSGVSQIALPALASTLQMIAQNLTAGTTLATSAPASPAAMPAAAPGHPANPTPAVLPRAA